MQLVLAVHMPQPLATRAELQKGALTPGGALAAGIAESPMHVPPTVAVQICPSCTPLASMNLSVAPVPAVCEKKQPNALAGAAAPMPAEKFTRHVPLGNSHAHC